MLDSSKLNEMICGKFGSIAGFSRIETTIPYTTIKSYLSNDAKCGKMPVDNFIKISDQLGITPEELYRQLELVEGE